MIKTLELPASELKHALAGLAKVISTRSSLPILGHVRVEPDGPDAVCLHGTDLDAFATCRISARNPENFPASTVSFDALNKLLKTAKSDLTLVWEEEGKLSVRYPIGGSMAKTPIESLPVSEWPPLPAVKTPANILDDAFKPAFKQALECASADSSRYVLNGACLDISQKDCHTIVGTDGRHLFAANTFTFPLAKSVIVPDRKFLNWSGFVEDGAWHLAVEPDDKGIPAWVRLNSNRWTFITKASEGLYPNWRQVVPGAEGRTRLVFSPESVSTILDALPCLPATNAQDLPVQLEVQNNQFCLKGRPSLNDEWVVVPVPGVQIRGRVFNITLNRTFLSKALRFGFTEFDFYSESEPLRFISPGRKLVIMPLRDPAPPVTTQTNPTTPQAATETEAAVAGEPSAAQPVINATEERKTMPAKSDKNQPLKEAAEQIEKLKESLKNILNEFNSILAAIRLAEKEKKATEKEVEGVRTTLRSLQKVQI